MTAAQTNGLIKHWVSKRLTYREVQLLGPHTLILEGREESCAIFYQETEACFGADHAPQSAIVRVGHE